MRLSRVGELWRQFCAAVRKQGAGAIPRIVWRFLSSRLLNRLAMRAVTGKVVKAAEIPVYSRTYQVDLPEGYPARAGAGIRRGGRGRGGARDGPRARLDDVRLRRQSRSGAKLEIREGR